MYANAGSMDEAHKLFDEMPVRTLISWTILMSGYTRHGPKTETLLIFQKMILLRACSSLKYLDYGREIHCRVLKTDGVMDSFVENALVMMYSSCASIKDSARVFDGILQTNVLSWSSMFNGYMQNGLEEGGLRFFCMMIRAGIQPDVFAFSMAFSACATLGCLHFGIQVHCCIIKMGFCASIYLQNSLMDFYRNLVSWNTIIKGLVNNDHNWNALRLFRIMMNEALYCDDYTLPSIFQAITGLGALSQGREVHGYVIKAGFESNVFVISSLLDMYTQCIDHESPNPLREVPFKIFSQLNGKQCDEFIFSSILKCCSLQSDLRTGKSIHSQIIKQDMQSVPFVTNTLLNLYSELLHLEQALKICSLISDSEISVQDHETMFKIFRRIQLCHGEISSSSAGHILNSCANPVLLNVGGQIQAYVTKRGLLSDPCSCNSLIRMYSKGGRFADAAQAFSSMVAKNSDSWTSFISANVNYGHSSEAIQLFTQMCKIHKSPNWITFTSQLKAYAHMGLVDEAFRLLTSMEKNYDIEPMIEHHSCIAWKILLSGCRIHGDMDIAKYIAEKLVEIEPTDVTANLLLQQVLLTEGNWDDATKMKTNWNSMRSNSSWIEVRNKVYEFISDEVLAEAISIKLSELERTMKELGYVADRNHLLHTAEEEEYAGTGLHHTEMKALAFGLLSLAPGEPIRIMKNVRMCGDCHSACKFMSTFLGRDLVVKDSCKYHNFSNGKCSCKKCMVASKGD
ncbi:hypothetical protein MKX01_018807 [Papaver californicum]|nr:hypothetical protein MKX01_018807 [Papaver californicum]